MGIRGVGGARCRARQPAILRCAMTAKGQTEKNSMWANVFRVTAKSGHCSIRSACLKRANRRHREIGRRLRRLTPLGANARGKTKHFPCRVRCSRISVEAGGAASGPCVSRSVDIPVLQHSAPTGVAQDRSGIGMPSGVPARDAPSLRVHRSHGLLENLPARRCLDAWSCRDRRE
jgi:hypothetical protein